MASSRGATAELRDHRDLKVWQVAMDHVVESYRLSNLLPSQERYGLAAQIRRAATSVPANIAEGHGQLLRGEYLHHLSIARGSLKELETHLAVAERLDYLSADQPTKALELCDFVSRMLTRLRRSLRSSRCPLPAARRLPPPGLELVSSESGFLFGDRFPTEEPTRVTLPHLPAAQDGVPPSDTPEVPPPECQEVLTSLWDYLDGNCASELAGRIDAHVISCAPCLRFRRLQECFFASLAELRWSPAPLHVYDRVRDALAAERRENLH